MRTQQVITGIITEPTTSFALYTNTSGAGQSISIWDINMTSCISKTTAGGDAVTIQLFVGGLVMALFSMPIVGAVGAYGVPFHHNCGGLQMLIPNGGTVTITQGAPAGVAIRTGVNVSCDIGAGS